MERWFPGAYVWNRRKSYIKIKKLWVNISYKSSPNMTSLRNFYTLLFIWIIHLYKASNLQDIYIRKTIIALYKQAKQALISSNG